LNITLDKINKNFGSNHVLKDVSFECTSGKAFGLLGRNGSGKSTTIRIIMDIFKADSGKILFDGKEKRKSDVTIGYLPEERGLYPKKNILEQITYFGQLRGLSHAMAKFRALELLERVDAAQYAKKRLNTLSKGNQQKIQLIIALVSDPKVLILDEPFSGLDPVNSQLLKSIVREEVLKDKIVLFSSHQMANVEEFCDDICIINKGNIVLNGNLNEIKKTYPRNKIKIIPSDDSREEFSKLDFESKEYENIILKNDTSNTSDSGVVFILKEPENKNDLLKILYDKKINLDTYTVLEPSLEEIFVEKAGDINE